MGYSSVEERAERTLYLRELMADLVELATLVVDELRQLGNHITGSSFEIALRRNLFNWLQRKRTIAMSRYIQHIIYLNFSLTLKKPKRRKFLLHSCKKFLEMGIQFVRIGAEVKEGVQRR